ncbi:MAG: hypothetical protein ACFFFC_00140 [Candidatus Thorarchaeota archaeon]
MSDIYDPNSFDETGFHNRTRKRAFRRQQRANRSGKPMLIFRINNRFKPPENDRTWIHLIPESHIAFDGIQEPYHERIEHFHAGVKQSFICSRTWKENSQAELEGSGKCIPCKEIENGANNISIRQLDAFLLLHLDWYYLVQAIDGSGNLLEYENDTKFHKRGDPIMTRVWQEAEDKELKRLRITRRELKQCEKVFGNLMHWSMGTRFLGTLSSKIDDLMRHCTCGGRIETAIWECNSCDKEILDLTNDGGNLPAELTIKQANQLALSEYRCPYCGNVDFLRPVRICNSCEDPEPLRLWEVDLEVGRVGVQTQSQLVIYDHRLTEMDNVDAKLVIPERNILHRVFAPDSLDYQAEKMKVRNPYKSNAREHVEDRDENYENSENDENEIPY